VVQEAVIRKNTGKEASVEEVIEALRDVPGAPDTLCAICYLKQRAAERSLRGLYTELVNDYDLRLRWRKTSGFCRLHGELASRIGDPLGTAILYLDMVDNSQATGNDVTRSTPWARKRPQPSKDAKCLCCTDEQAAEARYLEAVANGMRRGNSFIDSLTASHYGLCIAHSSSLEGMLPADVAQTLQQEKLQRLALLKEQLAEIIRKSDYRYQHEPRGNEKDAWLRALQLFSSR
jgi:uncharacterized protein (DUF2237 family)